jgi:hypothetical protein
MYCGQCGQKNLEGSVFCSNCGERCSERQSQDQYTFVEWYYAKDGMRMGPYPANQLLGLYHNKTIELDTQVWRKGLNDWTEIGRSELHQKVGSPPPIPGGEISNNLVWILAFVPILGTLLEYIIAGEIGIASGSLWFVTIAINCIICVMDERKLKNAGYDTKKVIVWAIFLVPVYLYKRAKLLKHNPSYLVVWCLTFALLVFYPSVISEITGIADPSAVVLIQDGSLYAYPDVTVEEMIDAYFANPKWEALVAEDKNTYVNVSGGIMYYNEEAEALIQFLVKEDDTFEFNALEIDGTPYNQSMFMLLLEEMYEEL